MRLIGAPVILGAALCGCQLLMPADAGRILNARIVRDYATSAEIDVFYGTNRVLRGPADCLNRAYGVEAGNALHLGRCRISAPRRRPVGELPAASERGADRERFFQIGEHRPLGDEDFIQALREAPGDELLLMVHGFNVRYEEAILRGAQIVYDLKFQGPALIFTWPAGAGDAPLSDLLIHQTYAINRGTAARSIEPFTRLLLAAAQSGKRVHVLVHSMGHQIVLPGLVAAGSSIAPGKIGEVILNAPDFAADDFAPIAGDLRAIARRVTLYCSPGDNALVASRQINGNYRIGLCKRIEGIDVINVNEIDSPALGVAGLGHGYYSGRAVLTDVFQTLLGVDARRRLFIRTSDPGGGENFILRR